MTSADHRAAYLYTVEPKLITMMQQCASGAKLRTAGPFFRRSIDHVVARVPLPRTIRAQSTIRRRDPIGVYSSPCLDRGASPVVVMRQKATINLRANATIMVFRIPLRPSEVRAWNQRTSSLSFWNWRKRHAN
jgi:hypothetical protein